MDTVFSPGHLLIKELDYELRIRDVVSDRGQADKRKILGRLLTKERQAQSDVLKLVDPQFDFVSEQTEINNSLDSIQDLIRDFEGPTTDSVYKRAKSRLAHVTSRVQRLQVDCSDEIKLKFKNESYATCLGLEAELHHNVKEPELASKSNISTVSPNLGTTLPPHGINTGNKSFPVYKLGIKFDGEPEAALNFIERVEETAKARHISKLDLFESASDLFTGNAIFWLRQVKPHTNDWDSLVAKLKKDFLKSTIEDDVWNEIKSRKQKLKEPVVIFIAFMENLFNRLGHPAAEATKVKYIKLGIHQEYRDRLALHDITSVEELGRLCKRLEEAGILRTTSKKITISELGTPKETEFKRRTISKTDPQAKQKAESANVSNTPSANTSKSTTCWKCRGPNHLFRNCLTKTNRRFCMKCGTPDVTVKSCPSCSRSGNE